ncbi:MAG: formate-dependent phosphoribosylglycinamide formyltransferase [Candidatus Aenigmarchaeota archaeon]|nr:formate-dependent phosphoribosylglycinamide formyltransferase [Candidatus Aenigmarchaeota archaeon]
MREVLGTPLTSKAVKIMLLGSGELGREVISEAQKLGVETIAVDRYENAPGHQIAHKAYTVDMKDAGALASIVNKEKPDAIIPEIECINLDILKKFEEDGFLVIPNAKAGWTAMQRERIRELIKEAGVETSKYEYADTDDLEAVKAAVEKVGYPCWMKPIMSSSGQGSSFIKGPEDVEKGVKLAKERARGSSEKLIIEQHIPFDIEVTELAVRHYDENGKIVTSFPKPVGHYQIDGDYHSSWQPWLDSSSKINGKEITTELIELGEKKIYEATGKITESLGGVGLFGCELFVVFDTEKNDVKVYGNECSPRPHDTGMVTFISHLHGLSEGGLHARAVLGLPVPAREWNGFRVIDNIVPGASHVILSPSEGWDTEFNNVFKALEAPGTMLRFFGKPTAHVERRMGVGLATDKNVEEAKKKAEILAHKIEIRTLKAPKWKKQHLFEKHLVEKGE